MMLLQAWELAKKGERVCLVDRNNRLGGAWETVMVEANGNREIEVEIASHVIEAFPGIYEYLEEASGVPFDVLDAQPMRVLQSGRHAPYFSRLMLLMAGSRMALGYSSIWFKYRLGLLNDDNDLINYRNKFWAFIRYQLKYLFVSTPMKGPRDGFVDFINRLYKRVEERGVKFKHMHVREAKRINNGWQLIGKYGENIYARKVHATTSCGLQQVSDDRFVAGDYSSEDRAAVIVEIKNCDVQISQTYTAFWRDPIINRISRIDRPVNDDKSEYLAQEFLLELRSTKSLNDPELDNLLQNRLEAAKILYPDKHFRKTGIVMCQYARNTGQLPRGELTNGFYGYYSNGNLAAGLAYWLRHQKPKFNT